MVWAGWIVPRDQSPDFAAARGSNSEVLLPDLRQRSSGQHSYHAGRGTRKSGVPTSTASQQAPGKNSSAAQKSKIPGQFRGTSAPFRHLQRGARMPRRCIRCAHPAVPGSSRCRDHTTSNWHRSKRPYTEIYRSPAWTTMRARAQRRAHVLRRRLSRAKH